jgi:putative flippase GtrA
VLKQRLNHLPWQQIKRFGVVGVVSTLAHVVGALFAIESVGLSPVIGSLVGFSLSFVVSYLGNALWTFKAETAMDKTQFARYAVLAGSGFIFNSLIMAGVTEGFGLSHRIGLGVIVFTWPSISFLINRYWIFKDHQ